MPPPPHPAPTRNSWVHVRAGAVLLAAVLMLVLGFPGLDLVNGDRYSTPASRKRVTERFPLGFVAVAAADVNRMFRAPLVDVLKPLQRPLRISQSWGLYGAGPKRVQRLELAIDDNLVYRSQSGTETWMAATLRYRRLRPMVDALCSLDSAREEALLTWLAARAAEDFPDSGSLEVRCTVAQFPDIEPARVVYRKHFSLEDYRL